MSMKEIWISIDKELPKYGFDVLVYCIDDLGDDYYVVCTYYESEGKWRDDLGYERPAKFWRILPESPGAPDSDH